MSYKIVSLGIRGLRSCFYVASVQHRVLLYKQRFPCVLGGAVCGLEAGQAPQCDDEHPPLLGKRAGMSDGLAGLCAGAQPQSGTHLPWSLRTICFTGGSAELLKPFLSRKGLEVA